MVLRTSANQSRRPGAKLRWNGMRVDLYPEADKMGKLEQTTLSKRSIPLRINHSADEIDVGNVAIRDMQLREQIRRER